MFSLLPINPTKPNPKSSVSLPPLPPLNRTRLNNEAFILQWPFGDINRMPKIDAAVDAASLAARSPVARRPFDGGGALKSARHDSGGGGGGPSNAAGQQSA